VAIFFSIVEILQSDMLGRNISKTINKITQDQFKTKVAFDKIEFQLFPPGLKVKNVDLSFKNNDLKIDLKSYSLGAYIDLRDVFQEKPTISELLISDSILNITYKNKNKNKNPETKNNDEFEKIQTTKMIQLVNDLLPINLSKINIEEMNIKYNELKQKIKSLVLRKRRRDIKVRAMLYSVDLSKVSNQDIKVDQLSTLIVLSDNKIGIKGLNLRKGVNELSFKGSMKNDFKNIDIDGSATLIAEISEVKKYADLSKVGDLEKGIVNLKSKIKYSQNNIDVKANLNIKNFVTDFCYGDEIVLKIRANNSAVNINEFSLKNNDELLTLSKPFIFYNFNTRKFIEETVKVETKSFRLKNALYYLRENLSVLKGEITGPISFNLKENGFNIMIENDLRINNLYLGDLKKPILSIAQGRLSKTSFKILDGEFTMESNIDLPNTSLKATGKISDGLVQFDVMDANVDFDDFGKFAGFEIRGKGKLGLVYSNMEGNVLKLMPKLRDFEFEEYKLANIDTDLVFNFDTSEILIRNLSASQGKANYRGSSLINYKTLEIDTNIQIDSNRYKDIKTTLSPLLGTLDFIPEDIFGNWNVDVRVMGKMTIEDLVVKAQLRGLNNYIYDESFEKIKFDLNLLKEKIGINNIDFKKSTGSIKGDFNYDMRSSYSEYEIYLKSIPFRELNIIDKSPIEMEASLNGSIVGKTTRAGSVIKTDLSLEDTFIAGRNVNNSYLNAKIDKDVYDLNVSLFGGEFKLLSKLFSNKKDQSQIQLSVDTSDIPLYFSILKFVDKTTLDIEGRVRMNSELDFPGLNYTKSNFKLVLNEFVFKKDRVDIEYLYRSDNPQFAINNGEISNWDLELEGRKFYLISKGKGDLKNSFKITNDFKIDASVLETMNRVISRSNGTFRGKVNFFNKGKEQDYEATVISNNLAFTTSYLPTEIKDTKLFLDYRDSTIFVRKLNAQLSAGEVSLSGKIGLENVIPNFDLDLVVKEAGFPILKKSNIVLSGNTNLLGNKPPYTLSGDVIVERMLIINDINDFTSGRDAIIKKQYDYLPTNQSSQFNNYLNFNVNVTTRTPLRLSNSFADIGMVGDLQLLGGENDPKLVGSLSLAPRVNKITFKNNEYILSKGNVFFYQQNKIQNPELDFIAASTINDYKVNLKVFGPVKTFNLELSSTPALAQEDIFSLIAFGYTKDLSANLSDAERESMTQAGVGSILFDSFKINETLKSEFGLQVNLGTQIQQDESSLLNQRGNDGTRVRSATTIEVKKKLTEAMNLSVSSTVGGSAGQKQSMNLNYNINKKVSVEGVYETRTAPEGEEAIINDTSLGADVKVRWSFK